MFPGVRQDRRHRRGGDRETARGLPGALRPLAEKPEDHRFAAHPVVAAGVRCRRAHFQGETACARPATGSRLRRSRRAVDPSRPWQVALLAEFGSAAGCSAAGWSGFSAAAERAEAPADGARRLWGVHGRVGAGRGGASRPARTSRCACSRAISPPSTPTSPSSTASSPTPLAGNELYGVPAHGSGHRPGRHAAALVTSVDISMFRGHDELASYCGVAPADSRSGTSVRSTSPQRGGNKQLKNLLIFSCNSLVGTQNRFGEVLRRVQGRGGMRHNKALKAVARKRLKVIYAVMRDAAPYSA